MNHIRDKLTGLSLSLVTTALLLAAFELFLRYSHAPMYRWDYRLTFLSEGSVYQNKEWGGFVYAPDARIHLLTYYIAGPSDLTLTKEYEYDIDTNSYGLVQRNEIDRSRPGVLFLGDSFTEGQGASPWFYDLEAHWANPRYQVINGGIQGTGLQAWQKLYEDLSKQARIEKLVVVFISDDWSRSLWQMSPQALKCLGSAAACKGSDTFLGLPDDSTEAGAEAARLAKARIDYLYRNGRSFNPVVSSQIYQQLIRPALDLWKPPYRRQFENNKSAAQKLVAGVGSDNVLFVQIPQKDEIATGPNALGRQAVDFIRSKGWHFENGFERCAMTLEDFHPNDGHPNAKGYAKLEKCIDAAVKKSFPVMAADAER